ncbi:MAG TPA: hypothetical protein VNB59_02185 [Solirubrobacterales bacterium]|jgi:hypothetical protein|nr:hypothetical protein [Solirubrobacterales bacterium]
MRSPGLARGALGLICLYTLTLGALAAFAPHTFYDDYPFIGHWVKLLPPYNEHLVTDVGGLYLGFAVVFAWAALKPERTLVLAASTGFIVTALLHLGFHADHLGGFATTDAIGELAGLGSLLIPPAVAIWAAGSSRAAAP